MKALIATFLDSDAFTPGQEQGEAHALWESASLEAPRLAAAFDAAWFSGLLSSQPDQPAPPPQAVPQRRRCRSRHRMSTLAACDRGGPRTGPTSFPKRCVSSK
jgi:hypothetical protein